MKKKILTLALAMMLGLTACGGSKTETKPAESTAPAAESTGFDEKYNWSFSTTYDAVIALGAVIRGSTSHYDYVCSEVSKGVASVALNSDIPVMFAC